jgi:hypothetical protein
VLDISGDGDPRVIGRYRQSTAFTALEAAGSLLYLADSYGGLSVVDVADPTHPRIRANYDTKFTSYDVKVEGDLAYLADDSGGLKILRINAESFATPVWLPLIGG